MLAAGNKIVKIIFTTGGKFDIVIVSFVHVWLLKACMQHRIDWWLANGLWPKSCRWSLALDLADTLVGCVSKVIACCCSKYVKQWIRTKYTKQGYGFRIIIHKKGKTYTICRLQVYSGQLLYFDRNKLGGDGAYQLTVVWFRVWYIKNKTR